MKRVKIDAGGLRRVPADRLSGRVLMVLIVVSALVFGAFYAVGFDMPFEDDANFNAPMLTDVLLVFVYLMLAAALAVCAVAVARGLRTRDAAEKVVNGVPAARIARGTVGLLVASLVVTFALGSGEPMKINGKMFAETFWLKATDMFINTSVILIVVAVVAVCYGLSGRNRR